MYKLLNKLFGWDYVKFSITGDIVRVTKNRIGEACIKINVTLYAIENIENLIWLTCKPEKYFPNK